MLREGFGNPCCRNAWISGDVCADLGTLGGNVPVGPWRPSDPLRRGDRGVRARACFNLPGLGGSAPRATPPRSNLGFAAKRLRPRTCTAAAGREEQKGSLARGGTGAVPAAGPGRARRTHDPRHIDPWIRAPCSHWPLEARSDWLRALCGRGLGSPHCFSLIGLCRRKWGEEHALLVLVLIGCGGTLWGEGLHCSVRRLVRPRSSAGPVSCLSVPCRAVPCPLRPEPASRCCPGGPGPLRQAVVAATPGRAGACVPTARGRSGSLRRVALATQAVPGSWFVEMRTENPLLFSKHCEKPITLSGRAWAVLCDSTGVSPARWSGPARPRAPGAACGRGSLLTRVVASKVCVEIPFFNGKKKWGKNKTTLLFSKNCRRSILAERRRSLL